MNNINKQTQKWTNTFTLLKSSLFPQPDPFHPSYTVCTHISVSPPLCCPMSTYTKGTRGHGCHTAGAPPRHLSALFFQDSRSRWFTATDCGLLKTWRYGTIYNGLLLSPRRRSAPLRTHWASQRSGCNKVTSSKINIMSARTSNLKRDALKAESQGYLLQRVCWRRMGRQEKKRERKKKNILWGK